MIYVLLAPSVIISLFGVVNTLVLTIYERTRDRNAAGDRCLLFPDPQEVRYESLITAMIGAIIGAGDRHAVAVAAVEALSDEGLVLGIPVVGIIVRARARRPGGDPRRRLACAPRLEDRGDGGPAVE
ncbi:MAG: hypothetical protein U0R24_11140 [Solirubrobacterales bacterium]